MKRTSEFESVPFSYVLEPVSRPVRLQARENYKCLGVQWYAKGVFIKEAKRGADIAARTLYAVEPGDFIYNRLFAWKGSFALVAVEHAGCVVSGEFPTFRIRTDRVLPDYLKSFCRNESLWEIVADRSSGTSETSRSRLKEKDLLALKIPLPSLSKQQRIVATLGEAEQLLALRQQADRSTADLIPAIFHDFFKQSKANWPVFSIATIAENRPGSIRTGPFGSDLRHGDFVETGVPVLGIENVTTNMFRWTRPRCVPVERFKEFERFTVFPLDVIVTIMGTVGRACVAPSDLPLCMSTKHLCVVTPDKTRIDSNYLWAALLHDPHIRQQVQSVGKGAIMEGWNATIIKSLNVSIPPLPLQKKFAAAVADIRAMQNQQTNSQQRLDDLFASLLHRAFRGEL